MEDVKAVPRAAAIPACHNRKRDDLPSSSSLLSLVPVRIDFATCHWSNSPPPTFSLDIMFTLTPYEHLPSKYKLLIRCKNVYHMTALINHKNQQRFSEQNIIFSAQNIPGVPGEDYPIFVLPPETQFDCNEQIEGEKLHDI